MFNFLFPSHSTCRFPPRYQTIFGGGLDWARQESWMVWPRVPVFVPDIVTWLGPSGKTENIILVKKNSDIQWKVQLNCTYSLTRSMMDGWNAGDYQRAFQWPNSSKWIWVVLSHFVQLTPMTDYSHATSILMVSEPDPSELETVQATTMLSISLVRLGMRKTDSSADQRLERPGQWEKIKVGNWIKRTSSPESPSTVHL